MNMLEREPDTSGPEPGGPSGAYSPEDEHPPTGIGTELPCPSFFQVQKTLAQEYSKMDIELKHQQLQLEILTSQLNCRINCLQLAEKEVTLTTHLLKEYSSCIPDGHPQVNQEGLQFDGGGSEDSAFHLAVQHYNGALLENFTQQHFRQKLEQISTIFGDTLKIANDKITQLEAELQQSKEITSQLVSFFTASQSQQSETQDTFNQNDLSNCLNSIAPPPPQSPLPPPPPDGDIGDGQDGLLLQPIPSPSKSIPFSVADSSGIEENGEDEDEVLSDFNSAGQLINVRVQTDRDPQTRINVPACLSSLSSHPSTSKSHAWRIYNCPVKYFECSCKFKCLTFTGLVNHFRKLKLLIPGSSGVENQETPPTTPSPQLIILEDEEDEFQSSPPPIASPPVASSSSTSPPSESLVPSDIVDITDDNDNLSTSVTATSKTAPAAAGYPTLRSKDINRKKKRYIRDPCKVQYHCNAVTCLSNGKPCTKKFASVLNMRRHKRTYHEEENEVPEEVGCSECGMILPDRNRLDFHQLDKHGLMKNKTVDGRKRRDCTLCEENAGADSSKCELMHKPKRKGNQEVEGKNARKRCKVKIGKKKLTKVCFSVDGDGKLEVERKF